MTELLDIWQVAAERGDDLDPVDLCQDCPELIPDLAEKIAILRKFQKLGQTDPATAPEQKDTPHGDTVTHSPEGPRPGAVVGSTLGRFRIIAELGRGGMGVVYRAHDPNLNRDVAIKVMLPELARQPGTVSRFLREARALAAVRHDHVVEVYQADEADGIPFVAMPFLTGETLQARLEREGRLATAVVLRIGIEIASGLDAVHACGLIHRDLKPSNVWLEAGTGRVKLLDFGLARAIVSTDGASLSGMIAGTPAYMSPEQANARPLDFRSDLFSLGTLLYEMATAQSPFREQTLTATLVAIGEKDPTPVEALNPAVPADLADLIRRLHSKRPEDRPTSASAVADALSRISNDLHSDPGIVRTRSRKGRRLVILAAAASAFVLAVGLIVYWPATRAPSQTDPPIDLDADSTKHRRDRSAIPLMVAELDVHHFQAAEGKKFRPLGVLGRGRSFGAELGDEIEVTARLSRPAFTYLIMYQPDGNATVMFPEDDSVMPEQTDRPRFPSRSRDTRWQLAEGTGLCVIAVLASDHPLPSYREWRMKHPNSPWKPVKALPDVVWRDDGNGLQAFGLDPRVLRGPKVADDKVPIVQLVNWLKEASNGTVSAVAFSIEEK